MNGIVDFQVPILCYHRVTSRPHPGLFEWTITPRTFRLQLTWLRMAGYRPISLPRLYDAHRGAARLPRRSVAITFDDGYEETATVAATMLKKRGYPAAVFLVTDRVGGKNDWDARFGPPAAPLLSWQQVNELANGGFEIGGHSATHPFLTTVPDADLTLEVRASRHEIERRTGRPVRWFAYPYGDVDERVRRVTSDAGYHGALTFRGGLTTARDDLFLLNRIPVAEADGLAGFAVKLVTGKDWRTVVTRSPSVR